MESKEEKIKNLLDRNRETIIERNHLEEAVRSNKKLRVKLGIDPTSPDLHLGHAVVLRKLREFQDLGHKAVLIIGDFTARIGDPTGRSQARKPLTEKEIKANMKAYLTQAGKIIDVKKTEIHHNSEWFLKEGVNSLFALTAAGTMQQMLHRSDFKKRLSEDGDITVTELLYPLLQGYDSVKVKADVELGGHDQLLNLLAGRKVQRHFGMDEQDIFTVPLLLGLDGERKMSKSYGNYIGLNDAPDDMFGKVMSIPDTMLYESHPDQDDYWTACTYLSREEILGLQKQYRRDGGPTNQMLKKRLAFEIVKIYHGEKKARTALEDFEKTFSKREAPKDAPEIVLPRGTTALSAVMQSGVVKSKGDGRRLIEQGGFDFDGATIKDPNVVLDLGVETPMKIGKRGFFRAKPKK